MQSACYIQRTASIPYRFRFVIAKLQLVLDTTKKQLRKDITRGHFGQGHFGHFRFRKRGHLLTIIKYKYFIIVAVLTASVFDFD